MGFGSYLIGASPRIRTEIVIPPKTIVSGSAVWSQRVQKSSGRCPGLNPNDSTIAIASGKFAAREPAS